MATGINPIQKAIIYLATFYKVASFPSGFFCSEIFPINLGLSPPPNQLLVFECNKTKSCEIKPAVWAMKMGSWDKTVGPSHIIAVHRYDTNYGKHYQTQGIMDRCDNGNTYCGAQSVCLEGLMSISLMQRYPDCWVTLKDCFVSTSPISIPISCDTMDNFLTNLHRSKGEGMAAWTSPS